jgi:hypothetical protein
VTAQDNLSPPQFHGTAAALAPGQVIEPGHPHNFAHLEGSPHVFFSPSVESARWYAMLAADMDETREHTYQVEPTGAHEMDPESIGSFVPPSLKGSRRTAHPLRIVREVGREAG